MPTRPPLFRPSQYKGKQQRDREHDAKRREAKPWRAWYKRPAWQAAREAQFNRQPLCERCLAEGRLEPATVVNHRKPHHGDWSLFIDPANHESTCKPHHDRDIQREERRGAG
ncbi:MULTISPECIES: HNH endonuclease [unclassified Chelatococcus]|uniref:HNH endonuclease n=1 Tax=unclassified Chelatococcus TaxID=2638111 RepID=UPI001BCD650C|nr:MULTISPECIES: HNH endonuclease [unclassified Chelatococcus]CAH1670667.1 HNH endonuclease [Hyphomicrobiales bacterium]MBS7738365.1 HNH endonuclease [Chelatococcus sp. HY11]MBX3545893.1 HNH endonuclease [Chelatococcus sp.]MCO5077289.1 HNH endonuclease [Chelatococcus sp.]CAH1677099.1 HNH endonuclease [Hyphomicrobiales bacterium]